MSSSRKTDNLSLNSWVGSDKPQRIDFNYDNEIIDRVISNHFDDSDMHVNCRDRDRWDNYMHTEVFYGNGRETRVIETKCPFIARFGIIFGADKLPSVVRFDQSTHHTYIGFFTPSVATAGLNLAENGTTLTVTHSATPLFQKEYVNYNENGVLYRIIMFR